MTATRIEVRPSDGGPPYQVVVGVGVLGELPGLIPKQAQTVVVIHPEGLGEIEIRPTHRVHERASAAIIRARKPGD